MEVGCVAPPKRNGVDEVLDGPPKIDVLLGSFVGRDAVGLPNVPKTGFCTSVTGFGSVGAPNPKPDGLGGVFVC